MRLLLVEDDLMIGESVLDLLRDEGYAVDWVKNGEIALSVLESENYDLILLDPPYASGAGAVALDKLARLGWIGPATWISLETHADEDPKVRNLEVESMRKVGKARITLLRMPAVADQPEADQAAPDQPD